MDNSNYIKELGALENSLTAWNKITMNEGDQLGWYEPEGRFYVIGRDYIDGTAAKIDSSTLNYFCQNVSGLYYSVSKETTAEIMNKLVRDYNPKFEEILEQLKLGTFPKEEVPKLEETIIKLQKTTNIFHNGINNILKGNMKDVEKTSLVSADEVLINTITNHLNNIAEEILKNHSVIIIKFDKNNTVFVPVPCFSFLDLFEFSQQENQDAEIFLIKALEDRKKGNYVKILELQPKNIVYNVKNVFEMLDFYTGLQQALGLLEYNKKGLDDEIGLIRIIRQGNLFTDTNYLASFAMRFKIKNITDQMDAFEVNKLNKLNFNKITIQSITGFIELAVKYDLQEYAKACIKMLELGFIKPDLNKEKDVEAIIELEALLKKIQQPDCLPNKIFCYSPLKFLTTDDQSVEVNFIKLLHFSKTCQIMIKDLEVNDIDENYSALNSEPIKTSLESWQIDVLNKWIDAMSEGKKRSARELITNKNCIALLNFSDYWDMGKLFEHCEEFLISNKFDLSEYDAGQLLNIFKNVSNLISKTETTNHKTFYNKMVNYLNSFEKERLNLDF